MSAAWIPGSSKCRLFLLALLFAGSWTSSLCAQQRQPAVAVQLPTFSFFTVNTTVSVPDRGNMFMGGVKRASSGSNQFGPPIGPGNRSIGLERQSMTMQVSAQIHDFQEMERQLFGDVRGTASTWVPPDPVTQRLLAATAPSGPAGQTAVAGSVEEIRRQQAAEDQAQQAEALALLEKGAAAEAAGKAGVARIHYQMAVRRATGPLRDEALRRLALLPTSSSRDSGTSGSSSGGNSNRPR